VCLADVGDVGFEHGTDFFDFVGGDGGPDVAVEVDDAALPFGLWIKFGEVFDQAEAFVADEELDSFESSLFEVTHKCRPARGIFFGTFGNSEYFSVAVFVDAYGDEDVDVFDFSAPAPFHPDAVEEDVGVR